MASFRGSSTFEYVDLGDTWSVGYWGHFRWGTSVETVAVSGQRLFVGARNPRVRSCEPLCTDGPDGEPAYYWIDVYDLVDPAHPRWVGAVESAIEPEGMFVSGKWLYLSSSRDRTAGTWVDWFPWMLTPLPALAVYDIGGDLPVLVARHTYAPFQSMIATNKSVPAHDQDRIYEFLPPPIPASLFQVDVYPASDGPFGTPREVTITLPQDCFAEDATAEANRVYHGAECLLPNGGQLWKILAWDIAADPPTLLWRSTTWRPLAGSPPSAAWRDHLSPASGARPRPCSAERISTPLGIGNARKQRDRS